MRVQVKRRAKGRYQWRHPLNQLARGAAGRLHSLDVAFAEEKKISEVHVFNTGEGTAAIAQAVEALPLTQRGLQDFGVEYLTDEGWKPVPGGTVTGNERVWVKIAFPPVRTAGIRLVVRSVLEPDTISPGP